MAAATKGGGGSKGVPVVDKPFGSLFVDVSGVGGNIVTIVSVVVHGLVLLLGLGACCGTGSLGSDAFDSEGPSLDPHASVLEPLLEGGEVGSANGVVVGQLEAAVVLVVGAHNFKEARRGGNVVVGHVGDEDCMAFDFGRDEAYSAFEWYCREFGAGVEEGGERGLGGGVVVVTERGDEPANVLETDIGHDQGVLVALVVVGGVDHGDSPGEVGDALVGLQGLDDLFEDGLQVGKRRVRVELGDRGGVTVGVGPREDAHVVVEAPGVGNVEVDRDEAGSNEHSLGAIDEVKDKP